MTVPTLTDSWRHIAIYERVNLVSCPKSVKMAALLPSSTINDSMGLWLKSSYLQFRLQSNLRPFRDRSLRRMINNIIMVAEVSGVWINDIMCDQLNGKVLQGIGIQYSRATRRYE